MAESNIFIMLMARLHKFSSDGSRKIYVGDINNNIYSRRVRSKHLYTHYDPEKQSEVKGWTIDRDACDQQVFDKTSYIIIKNTETEFMYTISTRSFMENSKLLRDRYFLPLEFWKEEKDVQAFKRVEVIVSES